MLRMKIILLIISVSSAAIFSQPDWVSGLGSSPRFQSSKYLTGFGSIKVAGGIDKTEAQRLVMDYARGDLSSKIRVNVKKEITILTSEQTNSTFSEQVSGRVQSASNMELSNLESEPIYFDQDEQIYYAFVYASKRKLIELSQHNLISMLAQVKEKWQSAKTADSLNDRMEALKKYYDCSTLLSKFTNEEYVLTGVGGARDSSFMELEKEIAKTLPTQETVASSIRNLQKKDISSIEDAAWMVLYNLKQQAQTLGGDIVVMPFSYRDTKMGSKYSRELQQVISSRTTELTGWKVGSLNASPGTLERGVKKTNLLTGTYWPEGDIVRVTASLISDDGKVIAGSVFSFPAAKLGLKEESLKPQNFSQALSDQKVFAENEVVGSGLNLEVWTNKGDDGLLFTKHEECKVFVRINRPVYLRLIYHMADGQRCLLFDNHYIDESKVNLVYEIPRSWECDEPFGAECLQVFAQSDKFSPLAVKNVDGYDIITGEVAEVTKGTRGLKMKKPELLLAEKRLTITTMDK